MVILSDRSITMDIETLAQAIGALEGVFVLDIASESDDVVVRFTINQNDEGWWSFELLCALERQYQTAIQAHAGNTPGVVEFTMRVPTVTIDGVRETVDQLVSAA